MARDYAARCPVSPVRNTWLVAAAILLAAQGIGAQKVRVEEELEAYPTESVDLRCQFIDGGGRTKLTQVSWIWEPIDGQRDNIAVYHPIYGQSFPNLSFKDRVVFLQNSLENPSIRISNLKMSDAGRYTCEYATYPSGNEQGTTTLIMLAKPKNSANVVTVQAGSKSVVVAQCEAADGKPAATIKWLTQVGGNHSTSTMNGPDGTVTVRSEYRLVPTPADDGRELTCMVEQRTQERPWTLSVRLSVEYPPSVSIEGYDNNWYVGRSGAVLFCQANANPPPTDVTWTAASGSLPDTVVVDGNKLTVRKVDDAVNTTFICEVKNKHGASRHQITTIVIEALEDPSSAGVVAGAVIGSLLALLLVVALVAVLLSRSRRQQRRGFPSSGDSIATGSGGSNGGDYGNKARLLFSGTGNNSSKNGTGANNNGPIYTYREGCDATGTITEKANDFHHHLHHGTIGNPPSAHDILLSGEMDEAERRKFELDDSMEEEEERYDRFGGVGGGGNMLPPAYHVRRGHGGEEEMDVYLDDDMESQRDEEKRTITPGPSTGAVIGGIGGALAFIGLIIGAIFYIRKRQEDAEGPPKHKPPPPVKAGSSTEMLNKPSEPPTATETAPLSPGEVYYEPTGGEPVTNLDDVTTGALNGGAPAVLGDPAKYDNVNELKDHVADGHHGNDLDATSREAPAANISRGESFVSSAMYV